MYTHPKIRFEFSSEVQWLSRKFGAQKVSKYNFGEICAPNFLESHCTSLENSKRIFGCVYLFWRSLGHCQHLGELSEHRWSLVFSFRFFIFRSGPDWAASGRCERFVLGGFVLLRYWRAGKMYRRFAQLQKDFENDNVMCRPCLRFGSKQTRMCISAYST